MRREGEGGGEGGGGGDGGEAGDNPEQHGEAVQVDPIKPTLTAPGSKRLKLKYDEPLSNIAVKFNVRRYSTAVSTPRG